MLDIIKNLPDATNYTALRSIIKTGDYGICRGTQTASEVIEILTGPASHVFKFFWIGDGLFCVEEWEGVGFQIIPASLKLQYYWGMNPAGSVKLGIAQAVIRDNPDPAAAFIAKYRVDKNLQPYGGLPTFWKILESRLGKKFDPAQVQAVCSTLAQQWDELYGVLYKHLMVPADYEAPGICQKIVLINQGVTQ